MKKTLFTLLLFALACHLSIACSCIGEHTVREEIKHSDAVLVGTILDKQLVTLTDSSMLKMFPSDTALDRSLLYRRTIARYDFLVQDVYKGKLTTDTVTIYTGLGGGDCGIRFEAGQKYILYGEKKAYFGQMNNDFKYPVESNAFWTYSCLRTMTYDPNEISEIEKIIGKRIKRKR